MHLHICLRLPLNVRSVGDFPPLELQMSNPDTCDCNTDGNTTTPHFLLKLSLPVEDPQGVISSN